MEDVTVPELLADAAFCTEESSGKIANGNMSDGSTARIRLRGIDTPECKKATVGGRSKCVDSANGERWYSRRELACP